MLLSPETDHRISNWTLECFPLTQSWHIFLPLDANIFIVVSLHVRLSTSRFLASVGVQHTFAWASTSIAYILELSNLFVDKCVPIQRRPLNHFRRYIFQNPLCRSCQSSFFTSLDALFAKYWWLYLLSFFFPSLYRCVHFTDDIIILKRALASPYSRA